MLPLLVLWAVPVAGYLYLMPNAKTNESELVASPPPPVVEVGERTSTGMKPLAVKIRNTAGSPLVTPVAGLVTEVSIKQGDPVKTGTLIARIDGAPLYGLVSKVPLFRPIESGNTGDDVSAMCELLHTLDYYSQSTCLKADAGVVQAIKAFQRGNQLEPDGVFNQNHTLFLRKAVSAVSSIDVKVGDRLELAAPLAVHGVGLDSVTLIADNASDASLGELTGVPITLTLGSVEIKLESTELSDEDAKTIGKAVLAQVKKGAMAEVESVVPEGGDGNLTKTYSGARGEFSTPQRTGAVPGSAVYPATNGTSCVFTVPDLLATITKATTVTARPLTMVGMASGEIGVATVDEDLIGLNVISDASTLPQETLQSCGS